MALAQDTVLYIQPLPGSSTVRQRVGYILNRWLQDFYDVDFEAPQMRAAVTKLAREVDPGLLAVIDAAEESAKETRKAALLAQGHSMPAFLSFTKGVPNASVSAASLSQQLHSLAPLDVARQMTLIEFDLLQAVAPLDFLKASKDTNKATTGERLQCCRLRAADTIWWTRQCGASRRVSTRHHRGSPRRLSPKRRPKSGTPDFRLSCRIVCSGAHCRRS